MSHGFSFHRGLGTLALLAAGLLGLASPASAQSASEAKAVQATLFGNPLLGPTTTILASTGAIPDGTTGSLEASSVSGNVPSLLSGDSLHATTIALPGTSASEASLGSLGLSVAGTTVSADFVMARAQSLTGSGGTGDSEIDGLSINGVQVPVSGAPNQTIPLLGGSLILNEQQTGPTGAVVNALHLILTGVADVVVASATASTP